MSEKSIGSFSCLFLLPIIPFLVLSFYTYPNLEDYAESLIPGVRDHVEFLYLTYDGRYFSSFLFAALNPLKFDCFFCYKLIPIGLIGLLFLSVYFLFKTFIPKASSTFIIGITGVFMTLFLLHNPSPSYTFYYMISSYVYLVPGILFIFFMAILCKILHLKSGFKRMILFFISVLITIAIVGGNELLFIPLFFVLSVFSYFALKSNSSYLIEVILLTISFLTGLFIAFTSPGTIESLSYDFKEERNFAYLFSSFSKSIYFTIFKIKHWLFSGFSFWLLLTFFVYFLGMKVGEFREHIPRVSLGFIILWIGFSILTTLFFILPYTWALGAEASENYNQVFIIPYLFFCLGIVSTVILFFLSISEKTTLWFKSYKNILFQNVMVLMLVLFVLFENNSISIAFRDLTNGTASNYAKTMLFNVNASKFPDANGVAHLCLLNDKPTTIYSWVYFNENSEAFHGQYKIFFNVNHIELEQCQ